MPAFMGTSIVFVRELKQKISMQNRPHNMAVRPGSAFSSIADGKCSSRKLGIWWSAEFIEWNSGCVSVILFPDLLLAIQQNHTHLHTSQTTPVCLQASSLIRGRAEQRISGSTTVGAVQLFLNKKFADKKNVWLYQMS